METKETVKKLELRATGQRVAVLDGADRGKEALVITNTRSSATRRRNGVKTKAKIKWEANRPSWKTRAGAAEKLLEAKQAQIEELKRRLEERQKRAGEDYAEFDALVITIEHALRQLKKLGL